MARNPTVWARSLGAFGEAELSGSLCSGEHGPGHAGGSAEDFEHITEPHSEQGEVGASRCPPEKNEDDCERQPVRTNRFLCELRGPGCDPLLRCIAYVPIRM